MFTGITVIDTASGLSTIFDLLLPALLILCGILLIKKAGNKVVKTIGTLLAAVGFFLLLWMLAWLIIALIII